MTIKTIASKMGNGLLDGACFIADANTQSEINKIDTQIDALTQQIADLQSKKSELKSKLSSRW